MELTLIGEMAKGEGMGSTVSRPGKEPGQAHQARTEGEFNSPRKESANPPLSNAKRPEVPLKRPLRPQKDPGRDASEAYLRSLRKSAPIGLSPKDDATEIKSTSGSGKIGTAGTPDGSPDIEGELAARNILRQVKPDYPFWARKQGVEAVVKYRLTVLPSGHLKIDDLQLDQTSGYRDLDLAAYRALLQWEFEPLSPNIPQVDQWGLITFNFAFDPLANP